MWSSMPVIFISYALVNMDVAIAILKYLDGYFSNVKRKKKKME